MGADRPIGPNGTLDIREVIVPLDGSAFARRAVGPAGTVAAAFGAGVTYVRVARSAAEAATDGDVRDVNVPSEPPADWKILTGDDAGLAVGEYVQQAEGSLVCMSSHGRGWPSSALMGSAAALVLAVTNRPLVLVGPACRQDWHLDGRLTACVDGEPGSETMVPTAVAWSASLGAHLTVVTVAEPAPAPLRPGHSHPHGPAADPQAYLDQLIGGLGTTPDPVAGSVIWDPVGAADGLVDWLGAEPVGLLVISSHGRRPRAETPLGHTALHIIHRSPVPVLVVPFVNDATPS